MSERGGITWLARDLISIPSASLGILHVLEMLDAFTMNLVAELRSRKSIVFLKELNRSRKTLS